jgi:hypothetical protein
VRPEPSRRVHAHRRVRRYRRTRRWLRGTAAVSGAALVVLATAQSGAAASSNPLAGSQGIVSSLPATNSAVTVSGQGTYAGLEVTVNQTQNLQDQAISVSWTGGTPTVPESNFQSNYLQIFECWGDPQSSDPTNTSDPGPLPTQCQVGGQNASTNVYPVTEPGFEYSRVLSEPSWSTNGTIPGWTNPCTGAAIAPWTDPSTGVEVAPFQAVDCTVVNQQANYEYNLNPADPQQFWLNPYFRYGTSNEVDFARTYADGTGTQLFQVQTGLLAPGLGCGQALQPLPGGGTKVPRCWLVVVPRGTPDQENPPGLANQSVLTSPLTPEAWANRIAIPLGFNPVGTSCSIDANAQQIIGNELAASAVSSWQPSLCSLPGAPSYSYIRSSDDQARQNIVSPTYGSAGMSVFTDPIEPTLVNPSNPIVYAPLTLSGVAVGFNIERLPANVNGQPQPDEAPLGGDQVAHIYLTPLLMAKLLTQSYQAQLESVTANTPPGYSWALGNPVNLLTDPDFLQWNPEFKLLSTVQAIDAGTALVEQGSSDATAAVWKWILSDPEAAAWLAGASSGEPPGDGTMMVNPYYSTKSAANPTHVAFGNSAPENYPKSDPYCTNTGESVAGPPALPARPLCILDWSPYATNMNAAAQSAGSANDGAKTTFNPANTPNTAWTANGPQVPGSDFIITITDTASAAQYGLQTASLSRSNDDGTSRTFVAPDTNGLLAGEQSLRSSAVAGVLQDDPSTSVPGAYPLTMLTYAAVAPEALTPATRQLYANFILYGTGDGQTPGVLPGSLPAGYVPLPAPLRLEALHAANAILNPPAIAGSPSPAATAKRQSAPASAFEVPTAAIAQSIYLPATALPTSPASVSTATHRSPVQSRRLPAVGIVQTSAFAVGALRWVLPILVLIGIGSILGSVLLGSAGRRKPVPADGPDVEPDQEE